MTTPRAFDITALTVNASSGSMRSPRTPFSPERPCQPPDVNPERHAQPARRHAGDAARDRTSTASGNKKQIKMTKIIKIERQILL